MYSPSIVITVSQGEIGSPSYSAWTVRPSQSSEQSSRTAIASSMPARSASFFWNTCITTRGCRASSSSTWRVRLKYSSV